MGNIVSVGCRGRHVVDYSRISVHPNVVWAFVPKYHWFPFFV